MRYAMVCIGTAAADLIDSAPLRQNQACTLSVLDVLTHARFLTALDRMTSPSGWAACWPAAAPALQMQRSIPPAQGTSQSGTVGTYPAFDAADGHRTLSMSAVTAPQLSAHCNASSSSCVMCKLRASRVPIEIARHESLQHLGDVMPADADVQHLSCSRARHPVRPIAQ